MQAGYHAALSAPAGLLHVMQGGKIELGAPTGRWQMIVVYRGKHCPVSKNYLASLQQIYYELDELGVEVIAVSGDGRERAESFVSSLSSAFIALHRTQLSKGTMRVSGQVVCHPAVWLPTLCLLPRKLLSCSPVTGASYRHVEGAQLKAWIS